MRDDFYETALPDHTDQLMARAIAPEPVKHSSITNSLFRLNVGEQISATKNNFGVSDSEPRDSSMTNLIADGDKAEEIDLPHISSEEAPESLSKATPGVLKVRLLEPGDRFSTHRILIQHHANTVFRDQTFSNWKFNANFDGVVARAPRTLGLAVTYNDEVIGVAWGTADSYILSDGPLFVTVQLIAVDLEIGPLRRAKAFLSLVAGIKQWAASLNASHSFIHVTTGSNLAATDRLMKAAGAQTVGGAYVV